MEKNLYPLITVGLSFYNREKTLANAIKSVLLQTYTNFEFILIDDGSTDRSYEIAKKFSETDSRIRLVRGEKNMGIPARLNQITDMARGEYIARMDSDDMMLPQKLEKQMAVLIANRNIELIDCLVYIFDGDDKPVGKWKSNDISDLSTRKILKEKICFYHATLVGKTKWFRQNRYNETYKRGADFELWCRSFNNTNYTRLYEYQYLYREISLSIGSYKSNRESLRKTLGIHYKGSLSLFELRKEMVTSYVKVFLYQTLIFFKLQHFLTATNHIDISDEEKDKITGDIVRINNFDTHNYHIQ